MRMTCMLDGVSPESLDSRIAVTDVVQSAPQITRSTVRRALGDGSLVTDEVRTGLSVTVKVLVKERRPLYRALLLERLTDWSRGTELRLPSRPDRFLKVRRESLFSPGGILEWTKELSMTFTAREVPFWQETRESALTLTDTASWYVPGSADAPVGFLVTNTGDTVVTGFNLTAGNTVALDGLLLQKGESVRGSADGGILTLTLVTSAGEADACEYLTSASADVLTVPCGRPAAVSLTSDGTLTAQLKARGRYL